MKEDAVNLEVDQRGLPPPRIWLSKYQSSLSPARSLSGTPTLQRIKEKEQRERGWEIERESTSRR